VTIPRVDVSEQPFRPAIETVLDLPVAPSVNETRKVHLAGLRKLAEWKRQAGMGLMANGQYRAALKDVPRFEIEIILNEKTCRLDADNVLKNTIDYLRELKLIVNDAPKNMRSLLVRWGEAPKGMRVIIRPCE
jgi:Holliday junction resolvase RusA-like endonuclease